MEERYVDVIIDEYNKYRIFTSTIDSDELLWHQDKRERVIRIFSGRDWQLQFDDQLPFTLEEGKDYKIPDHTYHRVIKGKDDLIIKITEK
jgi:hypothetical protein